MARLAGWRHNEIVETNFLKFFNLEFNISNDVNSTGGAWGWMPGFDIYVEYLAYPGLALPFIAQSSFKMQYLAHES
jgi:hypothetical protein